jgi:cytidylate kinase
MAYTTVCISTVDGADAGGTAQLAADALGLRLIDEDIVTRAAIEAGVDREVVADVERRKSTLVRIIEGLGPAGMGTGMVAPEAVAYGQPASDDLRGLITSVIEETASAGGVMIVSHAASHALGGREGVLRVLVTASEPTRSRRVASSMGIDEGDASRRLKRGDAGRADYIKRFYGVGSEQPTDYDLVINTDKLTAADAAALITAAARGSSAG